MAGRERSAMERLPDPGAAGPQLGRVTANVVLRPWFDWVAVRAVAR